MLAVIGRFDAIRLSTGVLIYESSLSAASISAGSRASQCPKSTLPERQRFRHSEFPPVSEQKFQGELNLARIGGRRRYLPERRIGRRSTVGRLREHVGIW